MCSDDLLISQTQHWVNTVIVKHSICPFAGREVKRNSIRYNVSDNIDLSRCLENLLAECRILEMDDTVETTLLIYAKAFADFDLYLDFVDIANALLIDKGYEGAYQLATFHPEYRFADSEPKDPANYTNRSPYPMLHIIREASLEQALKRHPAPETIPEKNIVLTRKLGLQQMQAMLQASYDMKDDGK